MPEKTTEKTEKGDKGDKHEAADKVEKLPNCLPANTYAVPDKVLLQHQPYFIKRDAPEYCAYMV